MNKLILSIVIVSTCLTLFIYQNTANAKEVIMCETTNGSYATPDTLMKCHGLPDSTLAQLYKKGFRIIQVLDLPLQVGKPAVYYMEKGST